MRHDVESFASNSTSGFPSLRPHEALFAFIRPAKLLQPAVSPERQRQRRGDAPVCVCDSAKPAASCRFRRQCRAAPVEQQPQQPPPPRRNSSRTDRIIPPGESRDSVVLNKKVRHLNAPTKTKKNPNASKMRIRQANCSPQCPLVCTCPRASGSVCFATTFLLPPRPSPRVMQASRA